MKKIAIKYGLWMFAGFVAFFLTMHLLGLSHRYFFRIFNGVFHIAAIYYAIREYRKQNEDSINNYVSGVAMGVYTSAVGVLGFTIFMLLYLAFDTGFMEHLRAAMPIGEYLNPITASLFILTEGIVVSLIGSYLVTRVIDMNLANA
ncbi:MAG TPA: DUF4199 domain-containing protein [Flavilitoribacter sp.]|nr:DUF4199 domain-containing protein [Lewinella sp.]MCB9281379.1 DUF4199 domain-containing protein [Lewinellaceae bacterium]HMQ63354.1 DUF4199 domain-containing protein [Flavilitoribacter sp.]HMQ89839.1 DUF4199 domain-containing protein [Flavilitoribacter sp.]